MQQLTLTAETRAIPSNPGHRIWGISQDGVRVGFVTQNNEGFHFGYVLTDPSTDDGFGANGHTPLPYATPASYSIEQAAQDVAEQWVELVGKK